ncbi:MAG: SDR family NAD(P)-dependent oxidoreductase [Alphaproteobacteria bacterium]|nr:SDR family NAD(P)-dependent oxidoreductase [Alphaproteobacteria bacterium]
MVRVSKGFAIVTGASTGIGLELARCAAEHGFDLLIAADESEIHRAAEELQTHGGKVTALELDLANEEGVAKLCEATEGRRVDALLANAGRGLGKGFLDQDFSDVRRVIGTNITGTVALVHRIGREMREARSGRILITGSIAGFMPGSFQAVYNASKAFLDSFAAALRNELKDTGVSVTCLMPGATETEFFERADLMDTKIGQMKKADAAEVAREGFDAMMEGKDGVITGWKNKLQVATSRVMSSERLAEQHRKQTEPGSATKN